MLHTMSQERAVSSQVVWQPSSLRVLTTRLHPGTDLKQALAKLAESGISGCIVTCTGSLTHAVMRLAGARSILDQAGPFEILSLSGTLSPEGVHLHMSLSDAAGNCLGGHLMAGSIIATTAELVVGVTPELSFSRPHDPATGYAELAIEPA